MQQHKLDIAKEFLEAHRDVRSESQAKLFAEQQDIPVSFARYWLEAAEDQEVSEA